MKNIIFLNEQQYGFRKNRTTTYAVMTMAEEIADAIDNDLHAVGIFIDLSKAFDTIDHNYLLEKMEHYGLEGQFTPG